jgi:hypothetical protein
MRHEIVVRYDKALIRQALRMYIWRRVGIVSLFAAALLLLSIGVQVVNAPNLFWMTISIMLSGILGLLYWIYHSRFHQSLDMLRRMESPDVQLAFHEDGVDSNSSIGNSSMRWAAFDELLEASDLYLLVYSSSGYVVLPKTAMSSELVAFIQERLPKPR